MPRVCSICTHPKKVQINRAIKDAVPIRALASRFDFGHTAVWRHRIGCLGLAGKQKSEPNSEKARATGESAQAGEFGARFGSDADRCDKCGTLFADPDPKTLVKRAERTLRFGEQIMERAIGEEDYRLGLQALDRVQRSLDALLKVHGLLQDGGTTVNVDARRLEAIFDSTRPDLVRLAIEKIAAGEPLESVLAGANDNRTLSG